VGSGAGCDARLFDLVENEPELGIRAVLGHWLFGYVHPYPDGNGRVARFLMNATLASRGYPWTVIRQEDRTAYLSALDRASVETEIRPFAEFIAERVKASNGVDEVKTDKRPTLPKSRPGQNRRCERRSVASNDFARLEI
jgi:hypothetical protein